MWIKTQDNTQLINCNHIRVEITYIIAIHDERNATTIGVYSTQEKALKVLEMIEQWIDGIEYSKTTKSYRVSYVFQMPQDGEVK